MNRNDATNSIRKSEFSLFVSLLFFASILNLGIFPLSGFLILLLLFSFFNRLLFSIENYLIFIVFFIILSLSFLFRVNSPIINAYIATYLYTFLSLLTCYIISSYNNIINIRAIKIVIKIHCFALFLQFLSYTIFKYYIDLHQIITLFTYESRFESSALSFISISRNTGFTIEPSNAASVITYLNIIYLILNGKTDKFFITAQLSTILTFSFAAIAISGAIIGLIMLYNVFKYNSKMLKIISLTIAVLAFFSALSILYWRYQYAVDYDVFKYRMVILDYFQKSTIEHFLFGQGLQIYEDQYLFDGVYLNSSHFRDSGFIINMIFSIGIIGSITVILLLAFSAKNLLLFVIIILAFMLKFDYMQPVFWLFLFTFISHGSKFKLSLK